MTQPQIPAPQPAFNDPAPPPRASAGTLTAFFGSVTVAAAVLCAALMRAVLTVGPAEVPVLVGLHLIVDVTYLGGLVLVLALALFPYRAGHVSGVVVAGIFIVATLLAGVSTFLLSTSALVPSGMVTALLSVCFVIGGGAVFYAMRAARRGWSGPPKLPMGLALGALALGWALSAVSAMVRFASTMPDPGVAIAMTILPSLLPLALTALVIVLAAIESRLMRGLSMGLAAVQSIALLVQGGMGLANTSGPVPGPSVVHVPMLVQGVVTVIAAVLLLMSMLSTESRRPASNTSARS